GLQGRGDPAVDRVPTGRWAAAGSRVRPGMAPRVVLTAGFRLRQRAMTEHQVAGTGEHAECARPGEGAQHVRPESDACRIGDDGDASILAEVQIAVAVHAPQLRRADGTVGIAGTSVDRGDLTVRGDAPDVAETGDVDGVVVGDRDVRGGGQDRVGGCTAVAVVVLGSDVALAVARDYGSLAVRADPIDAVLGPVGDVHDSVGGRGDPEPVLLARPVQDRGQPP